ncbi:MAG: methyltransferase domain-containing protein [Magnetococcales bacterium]|nr:methyltransferase domain-containing protein [Magnetococcales bacterium]
MSKKKNHGGIFPSPGGHPSTDNRNLNYYLEYDIMPGRQNLREGFHLLQQRAGLFRQLGLPPALLRGRKVLDLGPGDGSNAVFVHRLDPARHLLVDANSSALRATAGRLEAIHSGGYELNASLIEEFDPQTLFDVVLCEGVIPWGQPEPRPFLRRVAEWVAPGGVLVITCMDGISMTADMLRRLMATCLIEPGSDPREAARNLAPLFSRHLVHLADMTKSVEEWILSNLLQPLVGGPLSIDDALEELAFRFDLLGSSPHFLTDWRWYKSMRGASADNISEMQHRFATERHNLIDYRYVYAPRSVRDNERLAAACEALCQQVLAFAEAPGTEALQEIESLLGELVREVESFGSGTAHAMSAFHRGLALFREEGRFPEMPEFDAWFGRTQQHASFLARDLLPGI